MDSVMPVWDFSVPELEQLQAEQAEFLWNPLSETPEAEIAATMRLSSLPLQSALPPNSLDVPATRTDVQTRRVPAEPSWSRPSAEAPSGDRSAFARQQSMSKQDHSLPTQAPSEAPTGQEDSQNASQRQRAHSSDNSERSKAVNRESQRRFRLRQKVLSSSIYHCCCQLSTKRCNSTQQALQMTCKA